MASSSPVIISFPTLENATQQEISSHSLVLQGKDWSDQDLTNYKSAVLENATLGSISGGNFKRVVKEKNQNYRLYINRTETITKSSTGSITIKALSNVTGEIQGFQKVTVSDSTTGNIYCAKYDDTLEYLNGTRTVTSSREYYYPVYYYPVYYKNTANLIESVDNAVSDQSLGMYSRIRPISTVFKPKQGGSISVTNSTTGDLNGFQQVKLVNATVGNIILNSLVQQKTTVTETTYRYQRITLNDGTSSYVYCPYTIRHESTNSVYKSSGKLTITDSSVQGEITGYATITAKGGDEWNPCAISADITAGNKTESLQDEEIISSTEKCQGKLTLTDLTYNGNISLFNSLTLTNVTSSQCNIYCGNAETDSFYTERHIAGNVVVKNSQLCGAIEDAKTIKMTDSQADSIAQYCGSDEKGTVSLKNCSIANFIDGYKNVTLEGVCTLGGWYYGTDQADILTLKKGSSLTVEQGMAFLGGKDSLVIEKNASLFLRGQLQLNNDQGTTKVTNNGEITLLSAEQEANFGNYLGASLRGSGSLYLCDECWDELQAVSLTNFKGSMRKIGTGEIAQYFQGAAIEGSDNELKGNNPDLLEWLGDSHTNTGWLSGRENYYHILTSNQTVYHTLVSEEALSSSTESETAVAKSTIVKEAASSAMITSDGTLWAAPPLSYISSDYFTDKEDWFSLDIQKALDQGIQSFSISDNVVLYIFGENWFDLFTGSELADVDLSTLAGDHAGDLKVSFGLSVCGSNFINAGTYTVTANFANA